MIEQVVSAGSPSPAGHYSQAIRSGDFVFISGQVPREPDGAYTPADAATETRLTCRNLAAVAAAAGGTLADAVKVTAYLSAGEYTAEFNAAYREFFTGEPPPARTTVVAGLREVKVEIDAILYIPRPPARA